MLGSMFPAWRDESQILASLCASGPALSLRDAPSPDSPWHMSPLSFAQRGSNFLVCLHGMCGVGVGVKQDWDVMCVSMEIIHNDQILLMGMSPHLLCP